MTETIPPAHPDVEDGQESASAAGMTGSTPHAQDADVIIVGAGPAGSTTAYYLAQAGLTVLLLEKSVFPREKVCGDGLTPRAVKALVKMGIDVSPQAGWLRNRGLRIIGGGMRLELRWPELSEYPDYGLVRPRTDFDEILVKQAVKAGAQLREAVNVTGPVLDERTGRIVGVRALLANLPANGGSNAARSGQGRSVRAEKDAGKLLEFRACTSATTGRWVSRCVPITRRRDTTTTGWSPGSSCGIGEPASTACCRAMAGCSEWATARRMSA
jgi:hypothetical protein